MVDLTEEQKAQVEKEKQEAISKALEEAKKEHEAQMAKLRIDEKNKREEAVKKAEENAKLTEEQRVKKELEEQQKAEHEELETLRLEKKINDRKAKLVNAGVPEVFKNDSRLINCEDNEVDNVIKTIKEEWSKIAPKGANTNTNVKSGGSTDPTDEFAEFRNMGFGMRSRSKQK